MITDLLRYYNPSDAEDNIFATTASDNSSLGDANGVPVASFPHEAFASGLVQPGDAYKVINPSTGKEQVVLAAPPSEQSDHSDYRGISLSPQSMQQLGATPNDSLQIDFNPVDPNSAKLGQTQQDQSQPTQPPQAFQPVANDLSGLGAGTKLTPIGNGQREMDTADNASILSDPSDEGASDIYTELMHNAAASVFSDDSSRKAAEDLSDATGLSPRQVVSRVAPKPLTDNPDGSTTYSDGVTAFPDGHIEYQWGAKRFAKDQVSGKAIDITGKTANEVGATITLKQANDFGVDVSQYYDNKGKLKLQELQTATHEARQKQIQSIIDGIADGTRPPDIGRGSGLQKFAPEITQGLREKGINLSAATLDWKQAEAAARAGQSGTILKAKGSINTLYHSLDILDDLNDQWSRSNFPPLNKAQLLAAKNGALGPKAQDIATKIDGQTATMSAELANVLMGGNSPTERALALAGRELDADWGQRTMTAMIGQVKQNLKVRENSLNNISYVAGNRYSDGEKEGKTDSSASPTPTATPAKAATPPAGITPDKRYWDKTKQVWVKWTANNGWQQVQ